jgi:hypothetical protein
MQEVVDNLADRVRQDQNSIDLIKDPSDEPSLTRTGTGQKAVKVAQKVQHHLAAK